MHVNAKDKVRICHFSDLHLPLTQTVPPWRLLGKRFLGYGNIRFRRGKTHKEEAFISLLEQMVAEKADLTVMTGDLTNLALEFEFSNVKRMFREAGLRPETTLVIPGNHDRYTLGSDLGCVFEKEMALWLPEGFSRKSGFPLIKKLGPVMIGAMDTAVSRQGIRDAGRVAGDQLERLVYVLEQEQAENYWPVIVMHHPPFRRSEGGFRDFMSGLVDWDKFVRAMGGRKATVLHGHMHRVSRLKIEGLDVIGVPSASNDKGDQARQLAYHVYSFERTGLKKIEIVRHWPSAPRKGRFIRTELPDEI
jgi:3',5'-cyclic AMP phosphodiesterase CpdA